MWRPCFSPAFLLFRSSAILRRETMERASLTSEVTTAPIAPLAQEAPHLRRVLGRSALVLLFVVAVFKLNVVPSIAGNGGYTFWLWVVSRMHFFGPHVL